MRRDGYDGLLVGSKRGTTVELSAQFVGWSHRIGCVLCPRQKLARSSRWPRIVLPGNSLVLRHFLVIGHILSEEGDCRRRNRIHKFDRQRRKFFESLCPWHDSGRDSQFDRRPISHCRVSRARSSASPPSSKI